MTTGSPRGRDVVRVASDTTIVAVSSPAGPAARGVLRASGPDAAALLRATLRFPSDGPGVCASDDRRLGDLLGQRGLARARFDDGVGTQPALVLWMPGPRSYTREDVFELHLPGAQPLLDAALGRLLGLGARRAARGEFTRRAFVNGRLDLTRAEGVLELVSSSSIAEARSATELLRGGLSARVAEIRAGLEELRALTEASLDFDESDTGHVPTAELLQALEHARSGLDSALAWEVRRQPPSALPRVVLVGRPNGGKSTLFNALVGEERALVSNHAGTTRDLVAGVWELNGMPVLLIDTAGEDEGQSGVEHAAQSFAARAAAGADLLLHVVPLQDHAAVVARLPFGGPDVDALLVRSKAELGGPAAAETLEGVLPHSGAGHSGAGVADARRELPVSAATGAGLESLARAAAAALGLVDRESSGPSSAAQRDGSGLGRELFARHRAALESALAALEGAAQALRSGAPLDFVAEALREGTDALDEIEGRTTPEDLLDRIFARFCLGK